MVFLDRQEAGERLADRLRERLPALGEGRAVVLGIPRGGVIVAATVARRLGADLGLIVAAKLRAPHDPELAIGAVASDGSCWLDPVALRVLGIDEVYLEGERRHQAEEARRRECLFEEGRRPALAGRVVIVVDDGVATGATAMAAILAVRSAGARRVVFAAPVASGEAADRLRVRADLVEFLVEDPCFAAVSDYYEDFRDVEEVEVLEILDAEVPVRRDEPVARRAGVR